MKSKLLYLFWTIIVLDPVVKLCPNTGLTKNHFSSSVLEVMLFYINITYFFSEQNFGIFVSAEDARFFLENKGFKKKGESLDLWELKSEKNSYVFNAEVKKFKTPLQTHEMEDWISSKRKN